MKARITMLTLGVDDLERSLEFYRDGLGLPTEGLVGREFEHGAVAFFDLHGGLKLALYGRANIAHDAGVPRTGRSPTEFTIGHNVADEAEVDAVMAQAAAAGAPGETGAKDLLGRLCRLLPGPGRSSLGGRLQPRLHSAGLKLRKRRPAKPGGRNEVVGKPLFSQPLDRGQANPHSARNRP